MNSFAPRLTFVHPFDHLESAGEGAEHAADFMSKFMFAVAAHAGYWPRRSVWRPHEMDPEAPSYCCSCCPTPPFHQEMVEFDGWGSELGVVVNEDWLTDWLSVAGPTSQLQCNALAIASKRVHSLSFEQCVEHSEVSEYLVREGLESDALLLRALRILLLDPDERPDRVTGTYPFWVIRTAHELARVSRATGVLSPRLIRWSEKTPWAIHTTHGGAPD